MARPGNYPDVRMTKPGPVYSPEEIEEKRDARFQVTRDAFLGALAAGLPLRELDRYGVEIETRRIIAGLIRSSNEQFSHVNTITIPYSQNRLINWLVGTKISGWGVEIARLEQDAGQEGQAPTALTSTIVANPGYSLYACDLTRSFPSSVPLVDAEVVRESVRATLAEAEIEWIEPRFYTYS